MRRRARVLLICAWLLGTAAGQPAASLSSTSPLTLGQYRFELDRILAALEQLPAHPEGAAALRDSLPAQWTVVEREQRFAVPTAALADELNAYMKDPAQGSAHLADLQARVRVLRQAAQFTPADYSEARRRSAQILARREFRGVRGPNWWDEVRDRINAWIAEMLGRLFGGMPRHPAAAKALVWILIAVGLAVLAMWVRRTVFLAARAEALDLRVAPIHRRNWVEWLREAMEAAGRGDFRDAVHRAYWAAILRLDDQGVWRPDQARTPREYLRALPSDDPHRGALSALTRRFEVTWYGVQPVAAADFQAALAELEKLGCRLP